MSPDTRLDPARLLAELDALIGPMPEETPRAAPQPAPPPPAPEESPPPSPVREARSRTTAPRVLLVEDNADYRKVLRYLLASNGYAVSEARDGAEGLAAARELRPDLALLDFEMPRMNGYELLLELRRSEDTRKLPVVFLTGAANRRHLKDLSLDVARFLDKPISNSQLLETVADLLGAPPLPAPEAAPEEAASAAAAPPPAEEAMPLLEDIVDASGDDILIEEQKKEREEDAAGLDVLANDSPLVNRINKILVQAVEMGASDVHIEPQEKSIAVRVRVDGSLRLLCRLPIALHTQVAARVKIMSNLVITERRRPQDGQVRAEIKGRKIEFRVSTIPSLYGEKVVMRILGGVKLKEKLEELQFSPRDLEVCAKALQSPHGLLLVTGPTGSGKSTTLYTMVRQLNQPDVNIMTAEDPVEYELAGITQVPVRAAIGVTFEAVLRSFLRQDPDIMLVGEIRDLETAEIAVKAAITGHLVLSTLHTNSAPASVMRLTHMGLAPYLVADSLKLVIAQRLVRRICPECREPAPPSEEAIRIIGEAHRDKLAKACAGKGCAACHNSGYKGRMPLFEVMNVGTPELRALILASASLDKLTKQAQAEGMRSLAEAALDAVAEGATTVEEARDIILSE
ncbi:MAG: Flp pilus assembly complex ATPase component TadA [Elusimicrobia bacterium]|nr:Flp pilus assembly complex ATPase component TadA [Elusimicrobiota bacterium]